MAHVSTGQLLEAFASSGMGTFASAGALGKFSWLQLSDYQYPALAEFTLDAMRL
jgi:hypothetical protein